METIETGQTSFAVETFPAKRGKAVSRQEFRTHPGCEIRRADRYNVPFSLVHFRLRERDQNSEDGRARQFLEFFGENKRATDLLAEFRSQVVSILLLATDRSGAERFAERFDSKAPNQISTSTIRSYPYDPLNDISIDLDVDEHSAADVAPQS
jgi:hypothetical protein